MYAWLGNGSPLPPSTVGVAEITLSVPPRGLQHWHEHLNWTAHTFNTKQSGIWAFWRDIPTNVPHMSEAGSTLIDMMACSCNQLICTLNTYVSCGGESGNWSPISLPTTQSTNHYTMRPCFDVNHWVTFSRCVVINRPTFLTIITSVMSSSYSKIHW